MKFLKFSVLVATSFILLFSFSSCKKEASSVKKEQLLGKWDMIVQAGGASQKFHADLKGSGAMELDIEPYDGNTDLIILWDTENNQFNAHLDYQGISPLWELHGTIDPGTLSIAGQFKVNDPQSPVDAIFTMDRQ
jgi:hypothetical protein